jgi:hypothetical protein
MSLGGRIRRHGRLRLQVAWIYILTVARPFGAMHRHRTADDLVREIVVGSLNPFTGHEILQQQVLSMNDTELDSRRPAESVQSAPQIR